MRMIFIVGSRRSGTYWLQRIICAHRTVALVPSETYVFSDGIASLMARVQSEDPDSYDVGSIFASREPVIAAVRRLCDTIFEGYVRAGETRDAERTPSHVHHLPLIAEVYPEARFVQVVRDGRDVARSIVAQPWPPHTVAEAAEEWRAAVEAGRAAAPVLGERMLEVRYEDLLADPRAGITRLYSHLGLEGGLEDAFQAAGIETNIGLHDLRVGVGKWRESWRRRDLKAFERVAGDLLHGLGYDQGVGTSTG